MQAAVWIFSRLRLVHHNFYFVNVPDRVDLLFRYKLHMHLFFHDIFICLFHVLFTYYSEFLTDILFLQGRHLDFRIIFSTYEYICIVRTPLLAYFKFFIVTNDTKNIWKCLRYKSKYNYEILFKPFFSRFQRVFKTWLYLLIFIIFTDN